MKYVTAIFLLVITMPSLALAVEYCEEDKIKEIVGSTIYIGQGRGLSDRLITKSGNKIILGRYEPVKVLASSTEAPHKSIQYSDTYYIEVERNNGETGWYPCRLDIIEFTSSIPKDWPQNIVKLIHSRKVAIGMTKEQATMAWGKPQKINSSTSSAGVTEQWVYRIGNYIYFEGNKLTNIQTSR